MTNRFDIISTPLQGLQLIQRKPIGDNRGYFERFFCDDELKEVLESKKILQINHSRSDKAGTVRGMHFQSEPYAEKKFVSCIRGEIYDVAVDIRQKSPTFMHWYGELLTEDNHRTLLVPEGFAHGFQSLSDDCEILYLCTQFYSPEFEDGINPMDERIGIIWPLTISEISDRDRTRERVKSNWKGLQI